MVSQHGSGATGSSNGAPRGVAAAPTIPESPQNAVQTAVNRLVTPMFAAATSDPPGRQSTGSAVSPTDDPASISVPRDNSSDRDISPQVFGPRHEDMDLDTLLGAAHCGVAHARGANERGAR